MSFAPAVSSARIYVLPSMSLTPPREDHEVVAELYPSYWLLSVLNLIAPFCAIGDCGLSEVLPTGSTKAWVPSTLAILPATG